MAGVTMQALDIPNVGSTLWWVFRLARLSLSLRCGRLAPRAR